MVKIWCNNYAYGFPGDNLKWFLCKITTLYVIDSIYQNYEKQQAPENTVCGVSHLKITLITIP